MRMRMRMRMVGLTVGCLALVVGALTACEPAPEPRRVLVIGDSLSVGAVQQGLGAESPWTWTVSAEVGRSTNRGIAIAQNRNIAAYDLVIVALGTNDYLDTKSTYGVRIDKMMAALAKAPRVIWINVDWAAERLAPAATGVNPAIAAAPARHHKLSVGDWDSYVRTVKNMSTHRASDQVHYTASGYALRARWMEKLVPA